MKIWDKIVKNPSPEVTRQEVNVERWRTIYQGKSDWLEYYEINVDGVRRKRRMNTMNAAKVICQEMASMVFSEPPQVEGTDYLKAVLKDNGFFKNQVEAFERQCALGGQAIKLYTEKEEVKIDFVPATQFVPISWDNRRVTEAAFIDFKTIEGKQYVRIETHEKWYPQTFDEEIQDYVPDKEARGYEIKSELFEIVEDKVKKADISTLLPEIMTYQAIEIDVPLFVYIKNPITNNQNETTPIGMSLYGNAIDTLRGIDVAFNNMIEAPELCKPRIVVSDRLTRTAIDQDGNRKKYFDPSDRVFRTAPMDDETKAPLQDLTIRLDHEPIRRQIQTELDILSTQIGWSAGTISFDSAGGLKTATEVVSENSKTYKTRQKYVNSLVEAYTQLFDAIQALGQYYGRAVRTDFIITWDDSIIEDRNADSTYWISLNQAGIIPKWKAIMNIFRVDEDTAKTMAAEATAEQPRLVDFGA